MKVSLYLCFLTIFTTSIFGQSPAEIIAELPLRNIGPAFMTGRISDVAKDPTDPSIWYVATASSGVWKTLDNGTTWKAIFDDYGSFSTGCISVDATDPQIVWLGTGENQSQRSVGWGDGVYKSIDGGHSWTNMGLANSEHIGKILIHPDDHNEIHVAAQGPLWRSGGDRGIFKSIDGGNTWHQTLKISENTGASEIIIDHQNPNVLYASTYQRRRHVGILVAGGQESAIYKSIDRGETWTKIGRGLPGGDVGRIALAISPQRSNILYAMIAAADDSSGFYRSENAGQSWKKVNDYTIVDPQYYGEIYTDPHRFDCVYVMDVIIHVTEDGGEHFRRLNTRFKHVDNHALLFYKNDPNYLLVGCDGGIYESWTRGDTWNYHSNLPIMQFYRVGIDNDSPFYNVYGGTQDNSTLMGPSQTASRHGITNHDWTLVLGGDGFQARVDPEDANTVYAQYQYAGLVRYDRATGQRTELQPQPSLTDTPIRWHWDAPLLISHHDSKRLYFAAQHLYRSDQRGDQWRKISPDLSRGEDRNQREVMGKVWPPEAVWKNVFTSPYGTIVSLSESKLVDGLLVAGTDDGLIQITTDDGLTWQQTDHIEGVPTKAYVADVFASQHDTNVIYAVFNNHKEGDFKPYVARSTDQGLQWNLISNNLDEQHACWTIYEDFAEPNLLFLGSEFGLWCSVDAGNHWVQMKQGLPTIPVRDLEIQERESDLVLATFGRGFYIVDQYQVLRDLAAKALQPGILTIHSPEQYMLKGNLGYAEKGVLGDNFYTAPNPEHGTRFEVYLGEKIKSLKEARTEVHPSYEVLKKEDLSSDPAVYIQIVNDIGEALLQIPLTNKQGYQRVTKMLRTKHINSDGSISRNGPELPPGIYHARMYVAQGQDLKAIGDSMTFEIKYLDFSSEKPAQDYFAFYQEVTSKLVEAEDLAKKLNQALKEAESNIRKAQLQAKEDALFMLESHRQGLHQDLYALRGDQTQIRRFQYHLPGLLSRLRRVYNNQFSSRQITATHRRTFAVVKKELARINNHSWNSAKD